MRSRSALYVDAGYLIAAAATRLTGSSIRRGITVDYTSLLADLITMVEQRSGLPLLRVYWYDAARDGKATSAQEEIALLPRVKVRLGRIGVDGEQKGVDLRIGLDMVGHSRTGAVDTMYLLSGDDDLTEAVDEAQAQGVQVIVLAVPSRTRLGHGVSRHLSFAADGLEILDAQLLDTSIRPTATVGIELDAPPAPPSTSSPTPADIARIATAVPTPRPVPRPTASDATLVYSSADPRPAIESSAAASDQAIEDVAQKTYTVWAAAATPQQLVELRDNRPSVPRDLDRALLLDLSAAIGEYTLSDNIRFRLRAAFWDAVDAT
ncbi:NYN domain-containing protein [Rathayibacter sp. AY1C7]|uniref:NYN domain-containing protein n=1 Tax=Rathayibacter sp. AY1C7 TaxID=2080540 RepID=UPI000CE799A8|nr:NYN domain-containing protein [Rathayibacter sp. AY1C7]PPG61968.1 NYN domain-containing protein [Rathayibacter sp. AY1C7]